MICHWWFLDCILHFQSLWVLFKDTNRLILFVLSRGNCDNPWVWCFGTAKPETSKGDLMCCSWAHPSSLALIMAYTKCSVNILKSVNEIYCVGLVCRSSGAIAEEEVKGKCNLLNYFNTPSTMLSSWDMHGCSFIPSVFLSILSNSSDVTIFI